MHWCFHCLWHPFQRGRTFPSTAQALKWCHNEGPKSALWSGTVGTRSCGFATWPYSAVREQEGEARTSFRRARAPFSGHLHVPSWSCITRYKNRIVPRKKYPDTLSAKTSLFCRYGCKPCSSSCFSPHGCLCVSQTSGLVATSITDSFQFTKS